MSKKISIELEDSTEEALQAAVHALEERCGVVVSIEALAALCVETTVASGRLDELLDQLVLEALAAMAKQVEDLERLGGAQ